MVRDSQAFLQFFNVHGELDQLPEQRRNRCSLLISMNEGRRFAIATRRERG